MHDGLMHYFLSLSLNKKVTRKIFTHLQTIALASALWIHTGSTRYTLPQKKHNFQRSSIPVAHGSGSLTQSHFLFWQILLSLTLTQGLQNKIFSKRYETFEEECSLSLWIWQEGSLQCQVAFFITFSELPATHQKVFVPIWKKILHFAAELGWH